MANICVTGSRSWSDTDLITAVLATANMDPGTQLHVGDARGADRIAREVAGVLGMKCHTYQAFWDAEGRGAGFRRNIRMLETARPSVLYAFRSTGKSNGTDHCIAEARKRSIKVVVISADATDQQLTIN